MKFCILTGSPRPAGNTAQMLKPLIDELLTNGVEIETISLQDKDIQPCRACYACQDVENEYGCALRDDTAAIMQSIQNCDCILFATPIYSWFCTAPMKALMDRHYGMNKYYGSAIGSLWAGKCVALATTHGYGADYANEPFETAMIRLCKHSGLYYIGLLSARDTDDIFITPQVEQNARVFATELIRRVAEINNTGAYHEKTV